MFFPYVRCLWLTLMLLVTAPVGALAAEAGIGQVLACVPGAFVQRGGESRALEAGSVVYAADSISTDATGRVKILFNDDSAVNLGPSTIADMREYAESGTAPTFTLHVPQGVVRAVTGKIADQNPEGFSITTPEATVGIRGTIISLRTLKGETTVYVENTLRSVFVNGVKVPGGQKISIPGDSPRPSPIQPEDRRRLGRDLALLGGAGVAAAAPEPAQHNGRPENRLIAARPGTLIPPGALIPPDTPLTDIGLGNQNMGDTLALAVAPSTGHVAGNLLSTSGSSSVSGSYTFDVNLSSGAINNGSINLSGNTVTGALSVNLSGGTGSAGPPVYGFTMDFISVSYVLGALPTTGNVYVKDISGLNFLAAPSGTTSTGVHYAVTNPANVIIEAGQGNATITP